MKILSRCLTIAAAMFISTTVFAQDESNPWVVTIATNAIDTYPTGKTGSKAVGNTGNLFQNFYSTENWNSLPAITSIGLSRNITEKFSLASRLSFNKLNNFGGDESLNGIVYKSFDLVLKNSFAEKSATWEPFT